ncbi:MAG: hypothetical protein M5U13_11590 [Thermoanaerobaculia bacterium]|nr:hypothetical protein [Thermoanaerobaculia bacterium]
MAEPRCTKCGAITKEGFLLDRRQGHRTEVACWVEGPVERWWWGSPKLRGRPRYEISLRRCTRCGFLEAWATDPAP